MMSNLISVDLLLFHCLAASTLAAGGIEEFLAQPQIPWPGLQVPILGNLLRALVFIHVPPVTATQGEGIGSPMLTR